MIISKKHKYLFVELPRTGSTAISKELIENYDGEKIFEKHTPYSYFLKNFPNMENEYFVFSGIRNPMDRTVSLYFHLDKTLEANYWRLKRNKSIVKKLGLLFAKHYFSKRHNYVKSRNASFSDYFLKYYKYPYMDWNILAHKRFNHVIRFENLNDDFQKVLDLLGLESKRDLPLVNKTKGRDREFLSYFDEKSILRAKKVFGIYLKELNYEFPSEWGTHEISNIERFKFEMKLIIMKIYWRIVYFE